mmetsp:Transcript_10338/g.19848  ORF Transcript_10338/g.19848 Transcript_10338/m.19848 type:complete len:193 (-) Transcript_10338:433-1011(-)
MPRRDDESSGIPATLRDSTQEEETVDALIDNCQLLEECLKTYHYDLRTGSGDVRARKDKILKVTAPLRQYFSALEGGSRQHIIAEEQQQGQDSKPRPSKKRKSINENSGSPLPRRSSSAKSKNRCFEDELKDLEGEKKEVQEILKKLLDLRQELDDVEENTKKGKETLSLRRKVAAFYTTGNKQVFNQEEES